MKCPVCKEKINELDDVCPNCKTNFDEYEKQNLDEKSYEKSFSKILIGILVIFIILVIVGIINSSVEVSTDIKNTQNAHNTIDNDIIEFAKKEIKKKLRYPETVKFQNEEIIGKEDNKYVVSIYTVSDDKNHEEGRMKFVLGIKNSKDILEMFNIATNEDTCNIDVSEEFENLMKSSNYDKVYNQLFTSNLRKELSLEEFKGYQINMYAIENVSSKVVGESVLTSFYDSINKKSHLIRIKNGMIYSFN